MAFKFHISHLRSGWNYRGVFSSLSLCSESSSKLFKHLFARMLLYTVKANHVLYQNVLWSYKFNLKLHKRVDCLLGIYCVSPTETIWIVVSLLVNQNPIIMIVYQTIRESLLSTFFPWTKPTAHGAEKNLSAVYYGTVQPKFVFCVLEFCAVSYVWLWSRGKKGCVF